MKRGNVPAHLNRAADLIEQRGWIQGVAIHRNSGAVDIHGAIALSFGVPEDEIVDDEYAMAEFVPKNRYGFYLSTLDFIEGFVQQYPKTYNDELGRTKKEIVMTLRNAAAELDATLI